MKFGLVYGNDWFVIPCTLPAGSVAHVRGLVVSNTFGERLWIEAANRATGEPWRRFALFHLTQNGAEVAVWRGAQKTTGRGEASSGLAFDTLVEAPRTG